MTDDVSDDTGSDALAQPQMLTLVHATAVAIGERCVVLRGASGTGKSDLSLRLLALDVATLGAFGFSRSGRVKLVADDQVALELVGGQLLASVPETIRSRIEVRGLGILAVQASAEPVPVRLVVDLVALSAIPRMPDAAATVDLVGCKVPQLQLNAFEPSAALKVALALLRQA
jgi:HPr kinase/phosphorylase